VLRWPAASEFDSASGRRYREPDMSWMRRALTPLAAAWLGCQAASLVLGPLVLRVTAPEAVTAVACTCSHGDHAMCPMHHGRSDGPERCALRNAAEPGDAILTLLLGTTGLIGDPAPVIARAPARQIGLHAVTPVSSRSVLPDLPPPRA
jgi:hypothetical protein